MTVAARRTLIFSNYVWWLLVMLVYVNWQKSITWHILMWFLLVKLSLLLGNDLVECVYCVRVSSSVANLNTLWMQYTKNIVLRCKYRRSQSFESGYWLWDVRGKPTLNLDTLPAESLRNLTFKFVHLNAFWANHFMSRRIVVSITVALKTSERFKDPLTL